MFLQIYANWNCSPAREIPLFFGKVVLKEARSDFTRKEEEYRADGQEGDFMEGLKIRIFKGTETEPETTITIPLLILRFASKLMPKQAASALQEYGIDLKEVVELSQQAEVRGTLVEIEKHKKGEKIIISIE